MPDLTNSVPKEDPNKIKHDAEREQNKAFFAAVNALGRKLGDKGFAGMRGSSKEHKALMEKYEKMTAVSAQLVNALPREREWLEELRLKKMEEAREAAIKYVDAKRKGRDISSFTPGSRMGKNRYEGALDLIAQIDQEMERLRKKEEIQHQDADLDRPAVPQPEQTVIRQDDPEDVPNTAANEIAPAVEGEGGMGSEDPEEQKRREDLEKLEQMNKESERKRTEASIPPDPEDPFDMQGWSDKLNAIPSEKPGDPALEELIAKETVRCNLALLGLDDTKKEKGSLEGLDHTEFWAGLDVGVAQVEENLKGEFASAWTSIMEMKQGLLGQFPPTMQQEEPEKIFGIPENYLDPQTHVDMMKKNDITSGAFTHEQAENGVLQHIAMLICATDCQQTGETPTPLEFNNMTIDLVESDTFGRFIEKNGGTDWDSLEKLQKRMVEDPKSIYDGFKQHVQEEYLDPQTHVERIKQLDLSGNTMPYPEAKEAVLNGAAMMIGAKILQSSGRKASLSEFDDLTHEIRRSGAFQQIVEKNGGTSWGALERMQKRMTEGGEPLYSEYMKNGARLSAQQEQHQQQRELGSRQRANQPEHSLDPGMGKGI